MDSVETECTSLSITVELRPQGDDDIEGYRGFMVPTEQVNDVMTMAITIDSRDMYIANNNYTHFYVFCVPVLTLSILLPLNKVIMVLLQYMKYMHTVIAVLLWFSLTYRSCLLVRKCCQL